ncbi:MAG: hypothetical protein MZU97_13275 [Bacillus subtilis]|nr:hypothetical protein [Bacillus subtilis]
MLEAYKHHFQEMCDRLNYNCVVFLKGTGAVLAFRLTRPGDEPRPRACSLNVDYDAIPADNSRVFYGFGLTIDGHMQIVSGSVSLVDLDGDIAVVVFFESRIASFRDNQLPRIFWKSAAGVYLGHSDYVPYENELKGSMVGKSDAELFSKAFQSDFEHSDRAVLDKEVCFWDMMGKIKTNAITTLVKIEKFAYYALSKKILGIMIVYWPSQPRGRIDVDPR